MNRREFLKLLALSFASMASNFPVVETRPRSDTMPHESPMRLPKFLDDILKKVSETYIDNDGYLQVFNSKNSSSSQVPVAPTDWNLSHLNSFDRLETDKEWAIVLHWYGDIEGFDNSIEGYLRGFNSIRRVSDYFTQTSAHFLVGDRSPLTSQLEDDALIAIIQTQMPYLDGMPTTASHLKQIDYQTHVERNQYFVRALYQLAFENPSIHSILQDWFDGPRTDPNWESIAIEISGYDFDSGDHFPSVQKIANVVSVIWALMQHYEISANNILGHHEIDLLKSDPGKKFMALIRLLLGIKAHIADDDKMNDLVFGSFSGKEKPLTSAKRNYFEFVYDYFALTSEPKLVFEWEGLVNYWFVFDYLFPPIDKLPLATNLRFPLPYQHIEAIQQFNPDLRPGIHLRPRNRPNQTFDPVYLVANGRCLATVNGGQANWPKTALFKHRLPSGAEFLSLYYYLSTINDLVEGRVYTKGYRVGGLGQASRLYRQTLGFAIGYATAADDLINNLESLPDSATPEWSTKRFMDPFEFFSEQQSPPWFRP